MRSISSASASALFSTTLPTKPSQTMTSTVPLKTSRPSTLPMKLRPVVFSTLKTSRVRSLPFPSSSPIDIRPIRGDGVPITSWA